MNLAEEIAHGIKSVMQKKDGSVFFQATISKEAFCQIINWERAAKTEEIQNTSTNKESAAIALCERAASYKPRTDGDCPMLLAKLIVEMESIAQQAHVS